MPLGGVADAYGRRVGAAQAGADGDAHFLGEDRLDEDTSAGRGGDCDWNDGLVPRRQYKRLGQRGVARPTPAATGNPAGPVLRWVAGGGARASGRVGCGYVGSRGECHQRTHGDEYGCRTQVAVPDAGAYAGVHALLHSSARTG